MSTKLTATATIKRKRGDTGPNIRLGVWDVDSAGAKTLHDVSVYDTLQLKVREEHQARPEAVVWTLVEYTDPATTPALNVEHVDTGTFSALGPGTYYLEVELLPPGGGKVTSPTEGAVHLVITEDVG